MSDLMCHVRGLVFLSSHCEKLCRRVYLVHPHATLTIAWECACAG
jgi:hypothetical protein